MKINRLLLTTDFSESAVSAYRAAVELAKRFGAPIDLVNVFELAGLVSVEATQIPLASCIEQVRARLRKEAALDLFKGVELETHCLEGAGPDAVREFQESREHDLAILASRGLTGLKHVIYGSFAERLVRVLRCPTLVVRGEGGFEPKSFLYPHDLSGHAKGALGWVKSFAEEFKSKVHVLHVVRSELVPGAIYGNAEHSDNAGAFWESAESFSKHRIDEFAREALEGIECVTHTAQGRPAEAVVEAAKDYGTDLIVMTTHGYTGLSHMLLGSVAEKVVRLAPCSVLVVRPDN